MSAQAPERRERVLPVRPPKRCASCHTPIAKFIPEDMEWHPCVDCSGLLCEKCCDERKAS